MNDLADVKLECLPEQQVERVRMLVVGDDSYGRALPLVGVDDSNGTFVRLAGIPITHRRTVHDLSYSGRKILFDASADATSTQARLCLLDLPTGQCDWFVLSHCEPRNTMAALSPDEQKIAVLSSADDRARVDVIDIASRTGARLWTADDESWSTWESSISWSPDSKLLAATILWFDHVETHDSQDAVVVLSTADGSPQHRYDFHGHLGWLNDRDLGMYDYYSTGGDLVLADAASGTTQPFPGVPWEPGQSAGGPIGVLDDRIVTCRGYNDPTTAYVHTDRDGQDPRPLFKINTWPPRLLLAAGTDPLRLGQPQDQPPTS
ncbi:hypothetical protein GCM10009682_40730 [Luedemannella flava]|uniref:WD40 repeat domain-containing protein n=1 Tax=Luedemannella flava TaxID=349316 RepID=A0ABP4YJB2_9ACTN